MSYLFMINFSLCPSLSVTLKSSIISNPNPNQEPLTSSLYYYICSIGFFINSLHFIVFPLYWFGFALSTSFLLGVILKLFTSPNLH